MPILRIWDEESQSYQEIAALVGPQGPAGADGAPGQDGADGAPGEQGPAGPNEVSASTATSFNGLLKGNGSVVAQAVAGEDYLKPPTGTQGQLLGFTADNTVGAVDMPVSGGKSYATLVVGTSTSGHSEDKVDYLCDGTDDQVEINAAIASLASSGGKIVILDGDYNLTGRISVNEDNIFLEGMGSSTTFHREWDETSKNGLIRISGSNCIIKNISTNGTRNQYDCGIYIGFPQCSVIGCNFNFHETGIYTTGYYGHQILQNTFFNISGFSNAIDINSSDSIIQNNRLGGVGIRVAENYSNILITGNLGDSSQASGIVTGGDCIRIIGNDGVEISCYAGTGIVIQGNRCYSSSQGATQTILIDGAKDVSVVGNYCYGANSGIQVWNSAENIAISSNSITDNNIAINVSSCKNCVITGNVCLRGSGASSDYASDQYTIFLDNEAENCLISSNLIMGKNIVDNGTNNIKANNKYN